MEDDRYFNPEDSSSEFPPSYTEATSSSSPVTSYTSPLSAHLASLPSVIRNNQDSHLAHLAAQDADLLSLINPEIDALIGALLSRPQSAASATLILVPAASVPQNAKHVDDGPGSDEIIRVARVSDPKGVVEDSKSGKAGESSSTAREFSDWVRWDDAGAAEKAKGPQWWWKDEEMATRLAGHLQPKRQIVGVDRKSVREAVETQKQEKKATGVLGRFRSGVMGRSSPGEPSQPPPHAPRGAGAQQQGVTVVAEEVTFRRENEMGLWESMNGWGIVLRLNVRAL